MPRIADVDERRSPLEWILDTLAAIGLLWLFIGIFARVRPTYLDLSSFFVWAVIPAALIIGGVSGSSWCKHKRLERLIQGRRKD